MSDPIDRLQSRRSMPLRDEAAEARRRLSKADREFQTMFLTEFLRPMTEAMAQSDAEGSGLLSSGLDNFTVFWNQALAQSLSERWPLPALPSPAEPLATPTAPVPLHAPPVRHPFTVAAADASAATSGLEPPPTSRSTEQLASVSAENLPARARKLPHDLLERASRMFSVPVNLLRAVVVAESGGRADAVSPSGAVGLMQLMPATAKEMGIQNPKDPWENVFAGAKYLSRLLERFPSVDSALAAYNAGPGAVRRHGGVPPYPETRSYVRRVLSLKAELDGVDPRNS